LVNLNIGIGLLERLGIQHLEVSLQLLERTLLQYVFAVEVNHSQKCPLYHLETALGFELLPHEEEVGEV
jgi:hypothetical protein